MVRRLLEGIRQPDQSRLAECASAERHAGGTVLRVEAGRERRGDDVLKRAAGDDDAREAGPGRRAGAAVAREEQRVVIVGGARHASGPFSTERIAACKLLMSAARSDKSRMVSALSVVSNSCEKIARS